MAWTVLHHPDFEKEFDALEEAVQDELLAAQQALDDRGPALGRPLVDTLNGSKHANMKEIRFKAADGVWRVAFAFDPHQQAIVLIAGDKFGGSEDRFYKQLMSRADARRDRWLAANPKRPAKKKRKNKG